jgi:haloalkane dehalogenase
MEGIVAPIEWEDSPAAAQPRFRAVRSHEGEELVLTHNIFIEQSLVRGTLREYADIEIAEYRSPFLEPGENRRPMLTWPRQLPIGGEPENVVGIVSEYAARLAESNIPKLYIQGRSRNALKKND